jgi:hypothetical protein
MRMQILATGIEFAEQDDGFREELNPSCGAVFPGNGERKFGNNYNVIWVVQSLSQKYFASPVGQIRGMTPPVSPTRGGSRVVTNAG